MDWSKEADQLDHSASVIQAHMRGFETRDDVGTLRVKVKKMRLCDHASPFTLKMTLNFRKRFVFIRLPLQLPPRIRNRLQAINPIRNQNLFQIVERTLSLFISSSSDLLLTMDRD